jgi:hypothetical protein
MQMPMLKPMWAGASAGRKGLGGGAHQVFRHQRGGVDGLGVGQDHGELVAADPGDDVGGAQRLAQPFADGLQHDIAGLMAEAVIDLLEAIDVDEQQGRTAAFPGMALQRLRQPEFEGMAVGQPGDAVVERHALDLAFRRGHLQAHAPADGVAQGCRHDQDQDHAAEHAQQFDIQVVERGAQGNQPDIAVFEAHRQGKPQLGKGEDMSGRRRDIAQHRRAARAFEARHQAAVEAVDAGFDDDRRRLRGADDFAGRAAILEDDGRGQVGAQQSRLHGQALQQVFALAVAVVAEQQQQREQQRRAGREHAESPIAVQSRAVHRLLDQAARQAQEFRAGAESARLHRAQIDVETDAPAIAMDADHRAAVERAGPFGEDQQRPAVRHQAQAGKQLRAAGLDHDRGAGVKVIRRGADAKYPQRVSLHGLVFVPAQGRGKGAFLEHAEFQVAAGGRLRRPLHEQQQVVDYRRLDFIRVSAFGCRGRTSGRGQQCGEQQGGRQRRTQATPHQSSSSQPSRHWRSSRSRASMGASSVPTGSR